MNTFSKLAAHLDQQTPALRAELLTGIKIAHRATLAHHHTLNDHINARGHVEQQRAAFSCILAPEHRTPHIARRLARAYRGYQWPTAKHYPKHDPRPPRRLQKRKHPRPDWLEVPDPLAGVLEAAVYVDQDGNRYVPAGDKDDLPF